MQWYNLLPGSGGPAPNVDADDYVSKIENKIGLIDGSRLAELMIEFEVAVATDATYTVNRIDNDFLESI